MKFPRLLLLAPLLLLALQPSASAHQDPWGDIHPQVLVIDGNFAIDFNSQIPGKESGYTEGRPTYRMSYTPEGKLVAPRHLLERKRSHEENGPAGIYGKRIRWGDSELIYGGERSDKPGYLVKSPDGKLTPVRLPWPEQVKLTYDDDFLATAEGIAITAKEDRERLKFYWFPFASSGLPVILDLGPTICIYDFPVASNIVWAGGKFWIAYMRYDPAPGGKEEDGGRTNLRLWSWKPGDPAAKDELMESPGFGNSHLSMAAIGDRLCLAYHAMVPPYHAEPMSRIITVFRKAE